MAIYSLTKFGADWIIFVDARVLTRKLWTDRRWTDGQTPTDGECSQWLTEHSKNKGPEHIHLAMFWIFLRRMTSRLHMKRCDI